GRDRLVEVLPAPQVKAVRSVEHVSGRRAAGRVPLYESEQRGFFAKGATFGGIKRDGADSGRFTERYAGRIDVIPRVVRHLEPQDPAVGRPEDASGTK